MKDKLETEKKTKRIFPAAAGAFGLGMVALGIWALTRKEEKPPEPEPGLANLFGVVKDASTGNQLPDVLVTLNGYSILTNTNGYYQFTDLEPGGYMVQFSKNGYETKV